MADKFDPDAYLAEQPKDQFDPDEYLDVGTAEPINVNYSTAPQPQIASQRGQAFIDSLKGKFPQLADYAQNELLSYGDAAGKGLAEGLGYDNTAKLFGRLQSGEAGQIPGFDVKSGKFDQSKFLNPQDSPETQQATNEWQQYLDQGSEEHPYVHGAGKLVGSIFSPANKIAAGAKLGNLASKGGKFLTQTLPEAFTAGSLYGTSDSSNEEKALGGVLGMTGAGVGVGMAKGVQNIPSVMEYAGKGLQLPREIAERGYEVGGKVIGKFSPRARDFLAKKLGSVKSTGSKFTEGLENTMLAGELGADKSLYDSSKDFIKDLVGKTFGELDEMEQRQLAMARRKIMNMRGKDLPVEEFLSAIKRDAESPLYKNASVDDYLKFTIKEDPAAAAKRYVGTSKTYGGLEGIDPTSKDAQAILESLLEKNTSGTLNRMWQPVETYGAGSKIAEMGSMKFNVNDLDDVSKPIFSKSTIQPDIEASKRLKNVLAGKRAYQMATGGGAVMRNPLSLIGFGAPTATDILGGTGKFLEKKGMQLKASNFLNNPEKLAELSQRNDMLGQGARWALEGLNNEGKTGLNARSFVLSMQPQFRQFFAKDTTNSDPEDQP